MKSSNQSADLLEHVTNNNRICPQPKAWNRLWKMLPNRTQNPSGGWEPALPLILHAWSETRNEEKAERLKEHIEWADAHDSIEMVGAYLRGLTEDEWFHGDD